MKKLLVITFLAVLIYLTSFILKDEIATYVQKATVMLFNNNEITQMVINHHNEGTEDVNHIPNNTEVEVRYEHVNTDRKKDIIAIIKNEKTCGGGGCLASIFLKKDTSYEPIPFEYAVKDIEVASTVMYGMHDILINGVPMSWNNGRYLKSQN